MSNNNNEMFDESPKRFSVKWWDQDAINFHFKITRKILAMSIALVILLSLTIVGFSTFENKSYKSYDPYGQSIRFLQSRDDTGSPYTSLEDRQYKPRVSQLTSKSEAPNFSEYYGIDANIKNGSVMIERENFENKLLSMSDLERANKGLL